MAQPTRLSFPQLAVTRFPHLQESLHNFSFSWKPLERASGFKCLAISSEIMTKLCDKIDMF